MKYPSFPQIFALLSGCDEYHGWVDSVPYVAWCAVQDIYGNGRVAWHTATPL